MWRFLAVLLCVSVSGLGASAQTAIGGQVDSFKDTSMLKPPAGAKLAIIEWEDMECPMCAATFPIVHAAIAQYKIPLVRHDFLITGHIWSKSAAIYARYIQDKISPDLATEYRKQVFASQMRISSVDDIKAFTQRFLQSKGQMMPFALDPRFEQEVQADHQLGVKLNLQATPTLIVATPNHWIEVKDSRMLYTAIDQAKAETGASTSSPAPAHRAPAHK